MFFAKLGFKLSWLEEKDEGSRLSEKDLQ